MSDLITTYAEHDPRQYPEELPRVGESRTRFEVKYNLSPPDPSFPHWRGHSRTYRAVYADIESALAFVRFMREKEPDLNWVEVYKETRERVL